MTREDLARSVVIDVRSAEEFAERHVPRARHIPESDLAARLGELPKDMPIVTVCTKGGGRSQGAAALLREAGFDATALEAAPTATSRGSPIRRSDRSHTPRGGR